jgi:hypothetical protein
MELKGHHLIGEILVDLGFVTLPEVNEARRKQMVRPNVLLGEYLVEMGFVTPDQLLEALARQTAELYPGSFSDPGKDLPSGLPVRAFELYQLVRLPLFQHIVDQLEEGLLVEAWGEERVQDRVLLINAALASWLGMTTEAFRDKPAVSVINFGTRFFEHREEFQKIVSLFETHPTEPMRMSVVFTKPRSMTLEVRVHPLKNQSGEAIGTLVLFRQVQ